MKNGTKRSERTKAIGALALVALAGATAAGCNSGSRHGPDGQRKGSVQAAPVGSQDLTAPVSGASGVGQGGGSRGGSTARGVPYQEVAALYDPRGERRFDVAYRGHGSDAISDSGHDPDHRPRHATDRDPDTWWGRLTDRGEHLGVEFLAGQEAEIEALAISLARNDDRPAGPYGAFVVRVETLDRPGAAWREVGTWLLPEGRADHLLAFSPRRAIGARFVQLDHDFDDPRVAELRVLATTGGADAIERAVPQVIDGLQAGSLFSGRTDLARFGGAVTELRQKYLYYREQGPAAMLDGDPRSGWKAIDAYYDERPTALIGFAADRLATVEGIYLRLHTDWRERPLRIDVIGSADRAAGIDACQPVAHLLVPREAEHVFLPLPPARLARIGLVVRSTWKASDPWIMELGVLEAR